MGGMNPRIVAWIGAVSMLSTPVGASVSSVEWLEGPSAILSDSVRRHVVSSTEDHLLQWTVGSRDAAGRPLQAHMAVHNGASSYTADHSYSWSFDVGLPTVVGTRRCPSRLVVAYRDSTGPVRTDTSWFSWNPTDRAMIRRDSWAWWKCPWTDSMVLDLEGRFVAKASCDLMIANGKDSLAKWTRMRRGYASTQAHLPQWVTTEYADSLPRDKDSVAVQGPAERPTHALLFNWYNFPTHTMVSTGTDSLLWDPSGKILSTTRWNTPPAGGVSTRIKSTEYTWNNEQLQTQTQVSWNGPAESRRRVSTYLYSWDATSSQHRAPRPPALRRTAAGRVSLTLPASGPARVEWVRPDGRRALLHSGPVPQGALELATPRGMGFLRVQQAGQVRVHSLPRW